MATNVSFNPYNAAETPPGMVEIRIGVFFDGTQNNRDNSRAGGRDPHHKTRTNAEILTYQEYSNKDDDSYCNDLSNVARKEIHYKEDTGNYISKIYIEGIGTRNGGADSDDITEHTGVAYGSGDTGVREKVRKGCEEVVKKVNELRGRKKVTNLILDVFGFSRGAAAARNFVHEVNKGPYKPKSGSAGKAGTVYTDSFGKRVTTGANDLPKWGHIGMTLKSDIENIQTITVRFLGLYDTVSSYDPHASQVTTSPNFDNDVSELFLNDLRAKKIIQLAASDEHRENFMLTPCSAAGGTDFYLPGVHSDIGGSYTNNIEEKNIQIMDFDNKPGDGRDNEDYERILNNDLNNLIEQAWFRPEQVTRPNYWLETYVTRAKISNRYSHVTLNVMADLVNHNYSDTVDIGRLTTDYEIPTGAGDAYFSLDLTKVRDRLIDFVYGRKPKMVYYTNRELDKFKADMQAKRLTAAQYNIYAEDHNMLMLLRNKYLHWNSKFGAIGYRPSYKVDYNNSQITRKRKLEPNS
ncbi:DUF2235 domain-containing protein [Flavobacterium sp. DG1-102-2]|uniref:phospholipase effector Tle1 domain-containing protein n=1 Tax=Flavobacterium sp. DG1-102-2 TaxID=3081663 RepID=UPI002949DF9A|nr:DUF2235 domain-containing protein [Flavobacterium sp. DG1-102-2]MDV6167377.1 DUF2235 domain-containing protein [Flavobacterium sp. DG1-102-2]